MRSFIRLLALTVILSTALFWATQGAHTGWTQRYVTRTELDPVTGIEYPVKDMRFVPGVDFLGLAALVTVIIFGSSFLFRARKRPPKEIILAAETEPSMAEPETIPATEDQPSEDNQTKSI